MFRRKPAIIVVKSKEQRTEPLAFPTHFAQAMHDFLKEERNVDNQPLTNIDQHQYGREIKSEILGALLCTIDAHGPITKENVNSAVKRIMGGIRSANKRAKERMANGSNLENGR